MPKVKTKRTRYPEGWDVVAPTLESLSSRMREAETADTSKLRKDELLWPIFRLHHQRSRYIYDMYSQHQISRECYDFAVKQGYADAALIAKWKKAGYEKLCCLRCVQPKDTNFNTSCMPESDSRVLTDAGFLFLAEILSLEESRRAVGAVVLYACYEVATESIVYAPGRVVFAKPPARWVDFTQAETHRLWDERGDDYGCAGRATGEANRLTLRTTPNHEMYLQLGTEYEYSNKAGPTTMSASHAADIAPRKMRAEELAPGFACSCDGGKENGVECAHGYSAYRMFTAPAQGIRTEDGMSIADRSPDSPIVALGLRTDDQLRAFLELYGYWLGDGSMLYATDAFNWASRGSGIRFTPNKLRDGGYLTGLLQRLELRKGTDWQSWTMRSGLSIVITAPRWFSFFDGEYGVKYRRSQLYDVKAALAKQIGDTSSTQCLQRAVCLSSEQPPLNPLTPGVPPITEGPPALSTDLEEDEPEDEETPNKPVKWFWSWALTRLNKEQLRLVIEGLRQADGNDARTTAQAQTVAAGGDPMAGTRKICTSSVLFREQLVQLCLHAGYSAYFTLNTRAGDVHGFVAEPSDYCFYKQREMDELLSAEPDRVFKPIVGRHDNWWVHYTEATSELLPACDVRYDGRVLDLRAQRKDAAGWVALHDDDTVHSAATVEQLAPLIGKKKLELLRARRSGRKVGRPPVWQILTAAEYEQLRTGQRPPPPAASALADAYDAARDGRVWCVEVDHDDHLIFAQRARLGAQGVVTKVGRVMIVGNCICRVPKRDMEEGKAIECVHCGCRGCASGDA